jgi:hypothetical protein
MMELRLCWGKDEARRRFRQQPSTVTADNMCKGYGDGDDDGDDA